MWNPFNRHLELISSFLTKHCLIRKGPFIFSSCVPLGLVFFFKYTDSLFGATKSQHQKRQQCCCSYLFNYRGNFMSCIQAEFIQKHILVMVSKGLDHSTKPRNQIVLINNDLIWYLAELLRSEQTSWTQRLFVRAYTKTNITTLLTWIYQHSWIKQSTNQLQLMCCCCCCAKPCWVPFLFSVSNLPSIKHVLPEVLPLAICICNIHVCCIRFKTLHQKLGSCKLCLHQSCLSKLS